MKKALLLSLFAILVVLASSACSRDTSSSGQFPNEIVNNLDKTIEATMDEMGLPGVVVAVWVPGEGEYFTARGVADAQSGLPRVLSDSFRIGSITKTFVATAILQLVDQGRLSTSDKLGKFFPWFPNAEQISIRDLLMMRSGIPDFADESMLETLYRDPLAEFSGQELLAISAGNLDKFEEPGQNTQYCNANYVLLGEILMQILGTDIAQCISEAITEPLGMKNTIYPSDSSLPGNLHGYSWNPVTGTFDDMTVLNPVWAGAAGAMISDIYDLRILAKALYDGSLLSPPTQSARLEAIQMKDKPTWVTYGEGIINLGGFWGHNGTIFGFSSDMWYLPDKDAVIVISVNRLDLDDESKSFELFLKITRILFSEYVKW